MRIKLEREYLRRKYNKFKFQMLDYYMLLASLSSIFVGIFMMFFLRYKKNIENIKPYWLYFVLIIMGFWGFKIYRKEKK